MKSKGILAIGIIGLALYNLSLPGYALSSENKCGDPSADSSPDVSNPPDSLSMESVKDIIGLLDMVKKVMWTFDGKNDIDQFLVNHYIKDLNSCRMTEMFGSAKFEGTDTLFYGKPSQYNYLVFSFYGGHHSFYQDFDVKEIYKDIPQKILHMKDWYIGNNQILRGYFDTDDGCDSPVYATVFSFDPGWFRPYYVTEFKDKTPEQISEILSLTPFYQDNVIVKKNIARGIYESLIDPRYVSNGDTLKHIVWRFDINGSSYLELMYKEIESDSLVMVGGGWLNAINLHIEDW